jgi:hypothetical protein
MSVQPGDVSGDDYEDRLPDSNDNFLWCVGTVLNNPAAYDDSTMRQFDMVCEYARDTSRSFVLSRVHAFGH